MNQNYSKYPNSFYQNNQFPEQKNGAKNPAENPAARSDIPGNQMADEKFQKPEDTLSFTAKKIVFSGSPSGKASQKNGKRPRSHLPKWLAGILFSLLGLIIAGCIFFLVWYFRVASTLPDVSDLRAKASQFETTTLLDRNGNLLYEIVDPSAGRRNYISLNDISPYETAAVTATEDKDFFTHPGFDIFAIIRAAWQNLSSGTTVSGASTITQQLARNLLLSPEERFSRTVSRKIKEIFLAAEITRRYSKEEILELYLNENYYGNYAYGIEAAAQTYFGISAKYLDLSQAAFLAGLPQAPSRYDVFQNHDETIKRQNNVLLLMYTDSQEKHCIQVSSDSSHERVCVDATMVSQAVKEIASVNFEEKGFSLKYPHWVNYVRGILEKKYGAQDLYRAGLTVYTTIDPNLQELAQNLVTSHISQLVDHQVYNGALTAIQPKTGEILAMVGSPDFNSESSSGQVNMAVSPRQPGSSIKPLVYAAAFEKGWTPATLVWDVQTEFSPTGKEEDLAYSEPYVPVNYDGQYHGPVLVRDALANSFNIPAVKALQYVGIYDDPATAETDGFIEFAKRLHIESLDKAGYGLSIALGGGEVTLLELTDAFGVFANNGGYAEPNAILKIIDKSGSVVYEAENPPLEQVIKPEYAYQITSILSDNTARSYTFGTNSVLNLPFQSAVKTGTTNDFRDNWTVGYTPDLVTGVWVGNADYTPMLNTTGVTGAAPIWSEFMTQAENMLTNNMPSSFEIPPGIVNIRICNRSGAEASASCGETRNEVFAYYQPPASAGEDLWKSSLINTWSGLNANTYCPDFDIQTMTLNVTDPWAQKWIENTEAGRQWAEANKLQGQDGAVFFTPSSECQADTVNPVINFTNMGNGSVITQKTDIDGIIYSSDGIRSWSVEFGKGNEPEEWFVITNQQTFQAYASQKLAEWDINGLDNGVYTLRIMAISQTGSYAARNIQVELQAAKEESSPSFWSNLFSSGNQNEGEIPNNGEEIPEYFTQPTPTLEVP